MSLTLFDMIFQILRQNARYQVVDVHLMRILTKEWMQFDVMMEHCESHALVVTAEPMGEQEVDLLVPDQVLQLSFRSSGKREKLL